jgi:hypothetical protein
LFSVVCLLACFETRSHYVAQAVLKHQIIYYFIAIATALVVYHKLYSIFPYQSF